MPHQIVVNRNPAKGSRWTREEMILCLNLYLKLPYGQLDHRTPAIIELANLMGRKNILGFCLGQNHWCEYIEGDLSFLCVIAGFRSALWDACQSKNAEELTPKYPDFISERVYALSDATRWWYEYGKEMLLLNNV